jgi:hypothetical protein
MLIPTMCGGKQWMALFIMQQHERPASQDRAQSSNQSTAHDMRNEMTTSEQHRAY